MKSLKIRFALLALLVLAALIAVFAALSLPLAPSDVRDRSVRAPSTQDAEASASADARASNVSGAAAINGAPAQAGPSAALAVRGGQSSMRTHGAKALLRNGSPRGSSRSAFVRQQREAADAAGLPLEPPPVPVAELLQGVDLSDPLQRQRVVSQMEQLGQNRRQSLWAKARALGVPIRVTNAGGNVSELMACPGDFWSGELTLNQPINLI